MSEYLQPGQHPDPDSLNAFIEGVLPEHERLQCLAHLAECPICREVVYLAEELLTPQLPPVCALPEKVSFWKRWLTPIPALSAATVVGTLVLSLWLYQHFRFVPNAPEMVANAPHAAEPAPAPPETPSQPLNDSVSAPAIRPRVPVPVIPGESKSAATTTGTESVPVTTETPLSASANTLTTMSQATTAAAVPAAPPPLPRAAPSTAPQLALLDAASNLPATTQTGIAGTITDVAGAAVAGAVVKLHPITSPAVRNLTTDPKGQFNVAGLEPGRYELQVMAPGFSQMSTHVDIQPNQIARADSVLSIGSVAESISVTAEAAQVRTSGSARDQSGVQPLPARMSSRAQSARITNETPGLVLNQSAARLLPSKLAAQTTVVNGKLMLATDSAGALFLSQNAGKKWKAVQPTWRGKVISLVALPAPTSSSSPAFQLTTDSGAIWLSHDGSHWSTATAPK